ncbi:MAG: AI-2E family transporter [Methyloceanibacter sp.]
MQKSSPKNSPRKELPNPRLDRMPLDAWGWAERVSVIGLFALAMCYTAFVTREILVPVVLAWVVGAILKPIVDRAEHGGIPRVIAVVTAAIVALLIVLCIIGLLSTPFTYWIGRTTELAALIKEKLHLLSHPLAIFDAISHALSEISGGSAPASAPSVDTPSIVRAIISTLTPVVTEFVLFFFAMIFWMLYANEIKSGIVYLFSGKRARQLARNILDDAEGNVSRYFGTLAIVNLGLGTVAAGLAWAVDLPHPFLWGVLAATLNFIPYLGPALMVATLFAIGLTSFSTLGHALIAPLTWIGVTTLEGQFITPTIIGHRLTLNPFLVFLSIAFWAWMWGPLGAFLAVPLLISAVVVERHLANGHLMPRK